MNKTNIIKTIVLRPIMILIFFCWVLTSCVACGNATEVGLETKTEDDTNVVETKTSKTLSFYVDGQLYATVNDDSTSKIPTNPTKSGYSFVGWYFDENGNEVYTSKKYDSVLQSTSIYAKFEKNLPKIATVQYVAALTGETSINQTLTKYSIGGTDLGIPVYDFKQNKMYVFFGDTFGQTSDQLWRSNTCLTTTDFDLSDGISFDGYLGANNKAEYIVEGIHQDKYEVTKIPTGGIEIDGTLYMFYFSKYSWNNAPEASMNYGGCVKSTDGGNSWQRVYDLTWVSQVGTAANATLSKEDMTKLVNLGMDNKTVEGNVDVLEHAGYYFTQVFPVDGKDGYIYLLGEGGYRTSGMKIARVLKENFEKYSEYEYFNGMDKNNQPIWLKGTEGCKTICNSSSSFIINDKCGEQSIAYNPYLERWVITYLSTDGIVYRTATNIWGKYSAKKSILSYESVATICPPNANETTIYGGFIHEKWMEENGKIMYVIFSQYFPYYNSSILKITFE